MLLGCNYLAPTPTPDETEEAAIELSTVQGAVNAMMVDNGLSTLPNPVTSATSNMMAFPDTTPATSKGTDPNGNAYQAGDKAGFVLYEHDIIGDNNATTGLVYYLVWTTTRGTYTVDTQGKVTQVTTGYE